MRNGTCYYRSCVITPRFVVGVNRAPVLGMTHAGYATVLGVYAARLAVGILFSLFQPLHAVHIEPIALLGDKN